MPALVVNLFFKQVDNDGHLAIGIQHTAYEGAPFKQREHFDGKFFAIEGLL
jgi:hypothetical protein